MNAPQPWTADRTLDAAIAARAIGEAVPAMEGAGVKRLGSGWDFDAYEADAQWVFRFPRREAEQVRVYKDLLLLPWLVDRVDLPAPRHGWGVLRAPSFPYSWGGEVMLRAMLAGYAADDPQLENRSRFLGTCFAFMDWTWWTEVENGVAAAAARGTLEACLPR